MRSGQPAVLVLAGVLAVLAGMTRTGTALAASKDRRPNIVVILSDDIGFSDLGCYGGEIRTPNLDALAASGLRFSQFYNTGRCCPTRAALLTGLYSHQAGVGHMIADRGYEGYRGDLNRNCVTIAEVLYPAGYNTYALGKWHVTKYVRAKDDAERENWPLQRGFQRFYGTIAGGGSYYDPNALVRDNTPISPFKDPEYRPDQYYYTDAISDQAVRFIAEHHGRAGERPFFMYVAYTAAHWPMHALERDAAEYRGKYDLGYDAIRAARYEKLKQLGLVDANWSLAPNPVAWNRQRNPEWESRCMEVYAAMVDCMDQGIGRIVAELKRQGQLDNTLLFFLQDNGGCAEVVGRAPQGQYRTRPEKPVFPPIPKEALQTDLTPKQTRDGYPIVQGPGIMPGGPDTFTAYGRGWATVSNTPFREYKHWVHEGGISTPLVVHWPRAMPESRRNRIVSTPGHLIDLMATCVDVAGAKYPAEVAGRKIQPMEGVSLRPLFRGGELRRPNPLFWEHEGNRAVREGRWKLVAKEDRPWELYDMQADRTELNDLAERHPERVKELAAKWDAWAARANVLPLGAWKRPVAGQGVRP
jgi:arylsulfatase A-like enzyme